MGGWINIDQNVTSGLIWSTIPGMVFCALENFQIYMDSLDSHGPPDSSEANITNSFGGSPAPPTLAAREQAKPWFRLRVEGLDLGFWFGD